MHTAFTTSLEMFGNGVGIGTRRTIIETARYMIRRDRLQGLFVLDEAELGMYRRLFGSAAAREVLCVRSRVILILASGARWILIRRFRMDQRCSDIADKVHRALTELLPAM